MIVQRVSLPRKQNRSLQISRSNGTADDEEYQYIDNTRRAGPVMSDTAIEEIKETIAATAPISEETARQIEARRRALVFQQQQD